MDYLFDLVFVDGDILSTMVKLIILLFSFDFIITFAGLIKSIKSAL